jgi:hypothetical protein
MSVRAVIIEVSCPAIHAVACGTINPKILPGNDKDVMPPHLDRSCDAFATPQRRADANNLLSPSAGAVASKKILRRTASR